MKIKSIKFSLFAGFILATFSVGFYQPSFAQNAKPFAPAALPGNALSHFDFFYAGEAKQENMYIVRNGKIVWSYTHPTSGEISDAVMLSNGNILFAHQHGITEVTQNKKVVWNYDAPEGTEIHTGQPIGKKYVIFVQNSNPAKLIVMKKKDNSIVKELVLPTANPASIHGQFRHARLTASGTILVSHMDMGNVCEYDSNGKLLLTIDAPGVWGAEPLKNGNFLITTRNNITEVNRKAEVVWEYSLQASSDYQIRSPQVSIRLANGNTIISNWFNQWSNAVIDNNNQPLQAIEVSPTKKVVWVLRSWNEPTNLGPSTIIVPLDEPRTTEKVFFGDIH
ncbi:MAG: hypothetical protein P4L34_10525 [Paludibacter sp.]|nr:hypothetical protein [Paludibacter sp.]